MRRRWRWYLAFAVLVAGGVALTIDGRLAEARAVTLAQQECAARLRRPQPIGTVLGTKRTTYLGIWQRAEVEIYLGDGMLTVSLSRHSFLPWTLTGFSDSRPWQ
jgi:hypothetical protein